MFGSQQLFERLNVLGIMHKTYQHAPAFSVKDAEAIMAYLPPHGPCKNLFLKDKNNRLYLVTALFETKISLKQLEENLSAPKLHFANPDQLYSVLGVQPGSVTPFGLINDTGHAVTVVLDQGLFVHEKIGIHPLINTATTLLAPVGLRSFIEACGNRIVHLPV